MLIQLIYFTLNVGLSSGRVLAGRRVGGGYVSMAEPFLHLGDIRLVRERIRRGRCPHRVNRDTDGLRTDTRRLRILDDDIPVNGTLI
jgi:hypothetical protein